MGIRKASIKMIDKIEEIFRLSEFYIEKKKKK